MMASRGNQKNFRKIDEFFSKADSRSITTMSNDEDKHSESIEMCSLSYDADKIYMQREAADERSTSAAGCKPYNYQPATCKGCPKVSYRKMRYESNAFKVSGKTATNTHFQQQSSGQSRESLTTRGLKVVNGFYIQLPQIPFAVFTVYFSDNLENMSTEHHWARTICECQTGQISGQFSRNITNHLLILML